jgi:hypothetical protein
MIIFSFFMFFFCEDLILVILYKIAPFINLKAESQIKGCDIENSTSYKLP